MPNLVVGVNAWILIYVCAVTTSCWFTKYDYPPKLATTCCNFSFTDKCFICNFNRRQQKLKNSVKVCFTTDCCEDSSVFIVSQMGVPTKIWDLCIQISWWGVISSTNQTTLVVKRQRWEIPRVLERKLKWIRILCSHLVTSDLWKLAWRRFALLPLLVGTRTHITTSVAWILTYWQTKAIGMGDAHS
jgi:hypothetical protein